MVVNNNKGGYFRGVWTRYNKFKNKKTSHAGYMFDSRGEGELFDYLKLLEKAGELADVRAQPCTYLTKARIMYKPDFLATDIKTGDTVYYEFKGFETPVWRIKRRLWKHYGPGVLQVFKKNNRGVFLFETIQPKG